MTVLTLEGITGNARAAIKAMMEERKFQDEKYGPVLVPSASVDTDPPVPIRMVQGRGGHELGAWLLVVEKELEEAKDAATGNGLREKKGRHSVRSEIIQIMAVCLAALEQHGVKERE